MWHGQDVYARFVWDLPTKEWETETTILVISSRGRTKKFLKSQIKKKFRYREQQ